MAPDNSNNAEHVHAIPDRTSVRVRTRFEPRWASGFEVASHRGDRYQVRRLSDGAVLSGDFTRDEIWAESD